MFEYSVTFTNAHGKFAVLVRSAKSTNEAIKIAIETLNEDVIFFAVEAVYVR